jgi:23S rRNA pseudouridine1911/1915/1917 synthase
MKIDSEQEEPVSLDELGDDLYTQVDIVIDKGQEQIRIDKFLANRLSSDISRSSIQSAADAGSIIVNGKPVKSNYRIRPLDNISLLIPKPVETYDLSPENIPLEVLYEDDELLVINKQPGISLSPRVLVIIAEPLSMPFYITLNSYRKGRKSSDLVWYIV